MVKWLNLCIRGRGIRILANFRFAEFFFRFAVSLLALSKVFDVVVIICIVLFEGGNGRSYWARVRARICGKGLNGRIAPMSAV